MFVIIQDLVIITCIITNPIFLRKNYQQLQIIPLLIPKHGDRQTSSCTLLALEVVSCHFMAQTMRSLAPEDSFQWSGNVCLVYIFNGLLRFLTFHVKFTCPSFIVGIHTMDMMHPYPFIHSIGLPQYIWSEIRTSSQMLTDVMNPSREIYIYL